MLIHICCELKGLEEAEKSRGWPQRAGEVVLQPAHTGSRDITVLMCRTRCRGPGDAFVIGGARTTCRRSTPGAALAINEPWELRLSSVRPMRQS